MTVSLEQFIAACESGSILKHKLGWMLEASNDVKSHADALAYLNAYHAAIAKQNGADLQGAWAHFAENIGYALGNGFREDVVPLMSAAMRELRWTYSPNKQPPVKP